jgi:hypothetical protein
MPPPARGDAIADKPSKSVGDGIVFHNPEAVAERIRLLQLELCLEAKVDRRGWPEIC